MLAIPAPWGVPLGMGVVDIIILGDEGKREGQKEE